MCEMMLQPFMKPLRVFSDISLTDFNTLLTKAEGRDKLARVFQYFSRAIVGSAAYLQPTAGTLLATLEGNARTVMVQLASARRTHRWCKEFPVIQSLPQCFKVVDPVDRLFELLQKASLAAFLMIDHIGMLKQWKILSGGKRAGTGTIQLGLKIFTFCNIVGLLYQLKKIKDIGLEEEKRDQLGKCWETAVKHALICVQTAHLSLLYPTHDLIVGVCGIFSSSLDVCAQLPAKPAAKAKDDTKSK
ncbi:Pex11 [Symbiodinium natans]|uniref:Pex11 protein n=1 Tax=Symbiodinium natans TaxID=878477 RepID=A0A812KEJ3_9DINO|nr:Pex11 [Symbiodinium natans]